MNFISNPPFSTNPLKSPSTPPQKESLQVNFVDLPPYPFPHAPLFYKSHVYIIHYRLQIRQSGVPPPQSPAFVVHSLLEPISPHFLHISFTANLLHPLSTAHLNHFFHSSCIPLCHSSPASLGHSLFAAHLCGLLFVSPTLTVH